MEFLDTLGSKLAIKGAIYCVAVNMRCTTSPVYIKPVIKKQNSNIMSSTNEKLMHANVNWAPPELQTATER